MPYPMVPGGGQQPNSTVSDGGLPPQGGGPMMMNDPTSIQNRLNSDPAYLQNQIRNLQQRLQMAQMTGQNPMVIASMNLQLQNMMQDYQRTMMNYQSGMGERNRLTGQMDYTGLLLDSAFGGRNAGYRGAGPMSSRAGR